MTTLLSMAQFRNEPLYNNYIEVLNRTFRIQLDTTVLKTLSVFLDCPVAKVRMMTIDENHPEALISVGALRSEVGLTPLSAAERVSLLTVGVLVSMGQI